MAVLLPAYRGGASGLAHTRMRELVSEACLAAAKSRARGGLLDPAPSASAASAQGGSIGGRRLAPRKRRCWCIACGKGAGGGNGASVPALPRHGTSVAHLASAYARLNRPPFVLVLVASALRDALMAAAGIATPIASPTGEGRPARVSLRLRGQLAPLPHKRVGRGVRRSRGS